MNKKYLQFALLLAIVIGLATAIIKMLEQRENETATTNSISRNQTQSETAPTPVPAPLDAEAPHAPEGMSAATTKPHAARTAEPSLTASARPVSAKPGLVPSSWAPQFQKMLSRWPSALASRAEIKIDQAGERQVSIHVEVDGVRVEMSDLRFDRVGNDEIPANLSDRLPRVQSITGEKFPDISTPSSADEEAIRKTALDEKLSLHSFEVLRPRWGYDPRAQSLSPTWEFQVEFTRSPEQANPSKEIWRVDAVQHRVIGRSDGARR